MIDLTLQSLTPDYVRATAGSWRIRIAQHSGPSGRYAAEIVGPGYSECWSAATQADALDDARSKVAHRMEHVHVAG